MMTLQDKEYIMKTKSLVVTGSTRGIGYGLARSFLARGCSVVINGRGQAAVDRALTALSEEYDPHLMLGVAGDVTNSVALQSLWDLSVERFGRVDIWVNNAGWSGEQGLLWQRPFKELADVIATNVVGTINGAQIASHDVCAGSRSTKYGKYVHQR